MKIFTLKQQIVVVIAVVMSSFGPVAYATQGSMKCVSCATDHVCETFGSECWSRGAGEAGAISCEEGPGMCEQLDGQCGAKMAYVPFLGCTLPVGGCGGPHCFDWDLGN